jgi:hypothetical protein
MKILCPKHEEKTPSCHVYPDGMYKCFGCGAYGYAKDLGIDTSTVVAKVREDVEGNVNKILTLPVKLIRGLELHTDSKFYYIVWPDKNYYKKRRINDETFSRYVSPIGCKMPLFKVRLVGNPTLFIVEGEINAMSLSKTDVLGDIVSLGPSTNFSLDNLKPLASTISKYKNIVICVDNDAAGAIAGIRLKSSLLPLNPRTRIKLLDRDFNDILVNYGKEAVKEKAMEL